MHAATYLCINLDENSRVLSTASNKSIALSSDTVSAIIIAVYSSQQGMDNDRDARELFQ